MKFPKLLLLSLLTTSLFFASNASAQSEITTVLKPGDTHQQVTLVQKILNSIGKTVTKVGEETSFFGALTTKAIKSLQCEKGIVCSGESFGIIGPKTRSLLNSLASKLTKPFASVPKRSLGAAVADISSGLIAQYNFDEGNGITAGDSAGSNTGTLTNGPTWTTGKVGSGALSFDGVDDYVNLGRRLITSAPHSVCAWVNPQLKTNGAPQYILYQAAPMQYGLRESGGSLAVDFYNAVDFTSTSYGSVITDNWQHLCITVGSDRTTKIYINSSLSNTPTTFSNDLNFF